jgi:hypothetical protein
MSGGAGELAPAIDPGWAFPADAALMPRTDLAATSLLDFQPVHLDTVSSNFAGLIGELPAVRHRAGAGPEVFAVYRRAGIRIREETWIYRTEDEAEAIADRLVERGARLFWPYPLRAGRFPDAAQLVAPALWRRLNAKERLGELAPAGNLPRREVLSHEELACLEPDGPLYLKAAGDCPTGMGYAVRPCPDRAAFDAARAWFAARRADVPAVIVEEAVPLECCWCAGIAVGETETRCFGGAEQIFSAPGVQEGSAIDPERAFPEEGRALAREIGEAARRLGFRGIAGLDIGRACDGRVLVFDPNFRFNSSSAQLLFHSAAAARAGLGTSLSFDEEVGGSFADFAARLEAPIGEAWFVPLRLWNGAEHPLSEGRHRVSGMVLGRDRRDAEARSRALERGLAANFRNSPHGASF